MKSSPQLRRSRPQVPAVDLERLQSLDEWTTKPEQGRATALGAPEPPTAPANDPVAPVPSPKLTKAPDASHAAVEGARPRDSVSENELQAYHVMIPKRLHLKLKWIGDTTYGISMRQFILAALEEAAERALKERA